MDELSFKGLFAFVEGRHDFTLSVVLETQRLDYIAVVTVNARCSAL
jgi:hypothetical protein